MPLALLLYTCKFFYLEFLTAGMVQATFIIAGFCYFLFDFFFLVLFHFVCSFIFSKIVMSSLQSQNYWKHITFGHLGVAVRVTLLWGVSSSLLVFCFFFFFFLSFLSSPYA